MADTLRNNVFYVMGIYCTETNEVVCSLLRRRGDIVVAEHRAKCSERLDAETIITNV